MLISQRRLLNIPANIIGLINIIVGMLVDNIVNISNQVQMECLFYCRSKERKKKRKTMYNFAIKFAKAVLCLPKVNS